MMNNDRVMVSIYCLTYNHEDYIRDCLDGFIMQETDFPFEVIVHDDASTDHTADIVREYQTKYPDIIKPIFQKENQYRAKVPFIQKYIFPEVSGKYVGVCEGDDYFTDKTKLQRQVDLMESHPECHFCVAGVEEVSINKNSLGVFHPGFPIEGEIIHPNDFIQYASKYAFQTTSYLMRYDDWKEYICNPPEFKKGTDMGDITMMLYFGSAGETGYINRIMSCYRRGAPSSFSANRTHWTAEKMISHFEKQLKVWEEFDLYSNGKFHDVCLKKVSDLLFGYYILKNKARELMSKENKEYFSYYSLPKKMYVFAACVFKDGLKKKYLKTMQNRDEKKRLQWEINL